MAEQIPGRDDSFFFREDEQRFLLNRLNYPGFTVISGRPRTGKSWLVGNVLREVVVNSPSTLVGFTRCSAQDSDNLMRVVDDLYTRWREQANLLDQAKEIFKESQGKWPSLITKAVKSVVYTATPTDDIPKLVSNALNVLLDLQPGFHAQRLKYKHGQQLISALAEITRARRVILILDQWEQSEDLNYEVEHLRNFLQDSNDWPDTHFLITIRPGGEAEHLLEILCKGQIGFAEFYNLPVFDTESNPDEKKRMIKYLRDTIPACRTVDNPEDYIKSLQGYTGVLDNWTRHINRDQMRDLEDLLEVAAQAHDGQYPEFDDKFPHLDDASRKLCIRLALLPNITMDGWRVLRPIIMHSIEPLCLDQLFTDKLLENDAPPSFGHQSRSNFLRNWLLETRKNEACDECIVIIRRMAAMIKDATPHYIPYITSIFSLASLSKLLETDILSQGICEAALSIGDIHISGDALLAASAQLCDISQPDMVQIISMGLYNMLHESKDAGDFPQRDYLLEKLRALQENYPDNTVVRMCLAQGLVPARAENELSRCYILLEELRLLQQSYIADAAVRPNLSRGLFNVLSHGLSQTNFKEDQSWRIELLAELRALQQGYPEDAKIRQHLGGGLAILLIVARDGGDLLGRDALLEELRKLQKDYPDDTKVRMFLSSGLVPAREEYELMRGAVLFEELRALQKKYPEDAGVRTELARGLWHATVVSGNKSDITAFHEELSLLKNSYPEVAVMCREWEIERLALIRAKN